MCIYMLFALAVKTHVKQNLIHEYKLFAPCIITIARHSKTIYIYYVTLMLCLYINYMYPLPSIKYVQLI